MNLGVISLMNNNLLRKPGIYLIRNIINGKIYIGKTLNLYERVNSHKNSMNKTTVKKQILTKAIEKYGWENFEVEILEVFDYIDNEILLQKEAGWIAKFDSTNDSIGYNILKYSIDRTGVKHTDETKERWKKNKRFVGESNPFYGRVHSEETRRKISESLKGKPGKVGKDNPFYGKTHSKETLERIALSKNRKVKQIDPITNEIIRIWDSVSKAAKGLGSNGKSGGGGIVRVCKKCTDKKGNIRKTALGFKWEYVDQKTDTINNPVAPSVELQFPVVLPNFNVVGM